MKKILSKFALLALIIIAFSSCEKDDGAENDNTGRISFNATLNAMINNMNRQEVTDLPDCSDAEPAYVDIVATGPMNIGSIAAPFRVDLEAAGETYVTAQDEELTDVPAGDYQLTYFVVYDAENNPIWIAPTAGNYEQFVEEPLPLDFTVQSGEDTEVSVDVLCFENRILNEFGNLFFSLDPHMAIEFCIVGNTCGAGDASFSTTVYSGSDNTGSLLYMDMANTPGEALCMALPDLDGEDQYYFEISMDGAVIRSGVITDADVKALHDGETNIDPYIFYEGDSCTSTDSPDLFGTGGGNTGGEVPEGSFAIPYTETFNAATAESSLADFGYSTENLSGETVSGPGTASLLENTFPTLADETVTETAYGIQYGYANTSAETSTGTVDNVVKTSAFQATAGDYTLTYDVGYIKSHDNHSVEVYFSDDSDGSFENGTWTMIDEVSEEDLTADGVGRQEFQRRSATVSTSGNFYVAFRFRAIIDAEGEGTRWRIDNIQVEADGSTGGGDTGSESDDVISYFESFESSTADDNVQTYNYMNEILAATTVVDPESSTFSLTGNDKFAAESDVTSSSTWGLQGGYVNKDDAGATSAGIVDNVIVSPLFTTSTGGAYNLTYDIAESAGSDASTLKVYYSEDSNGSFDNGTWTLLETHDQNNSGPGRQEFGRITQSINVSGDFYVAFRHEATIGAPDASNNATRWRLDNIRVANQ